MRATHHVLLDNEKLKHFVWNVSALVNRFDFQLIYVEERCAKNIIKLQKKNVLSKGWLHCEMINWFFSRKKIQSDTRESSKCFV